jgi:hypothetical protein
MCREQGFRLVEKVVGGIEGRCDAFNAQKIDNARRIVSVNPHAVLAT